METNAQTQGDKEKDSSGKKLYLIIISLLSILCIILGWQYWEQKNRADKVVVVVEQVKTENTSVKTELLELQQEYATLETNDKAVQAQLDEKKAEIVNLLAQAEKHKDDAYIISKLKKEAATLRKIMRGFVGTIDSLNTLNKTLIVEKDRVKADLGKEQTKSSKLSKEKEDLQGVVSLGSILKAGGIKASGVRFKSGGKKEIETNKAKKVEKLKVIFTLGENKIAKKGNKDVYIRVLTPDGKELTLADDESNMFTFNGVRGFFSSKETISYDNQETTMIMFCERKDGFLPGKYIIEIYSDQANIGQTTLKLE